MDDFREGVAIPRALTSYPSDAGQTLMQTLSARVEAEPFNAVATAIFVCAILHTFAAARFTRWAHHVQASHDARQRGDTPPRPHLVAELLHSLGEVEAVFGLWAVVLLAALTVYAGWGPAEHYFSEGVTYTEPLFVVVIMALASTRPIVELSETVLSRLAALLGGGPAGWWATVLTIGPVLGSFITEPAAMTICALLLARQFFGRRPSTRLKYATLGLLFVNVSIGGTLTHFAAPPVLMVSRPWMWDTAFMFSHVGWRAVVALVASSALTFMVFRAELLSLPRAAPVGDDGSQTPAWPVPPWLTLAHVAVMAWTIVNAHSPALFIGGFLFFLGLAKATSAYQGAIELRAPLLVGFFLAGLVIHGGLQGWWIAPLLGRLGETTLFLAATVLTSFNDNALITYLATLVPTFSEPMKLAVVQGAVTGGGLTVIANAPNPAGQALLGRFFDGAVSPLALFAGALPPTIVAALVFRLL